jgi:hypothetical protein
MSRQEYVPSSGVNRHLVELSIPFSGSALCILLLLNSIPNISRSVETSILGLVCY